MDPAASPVTPALEPPAAPTATVAPVPTRTQDCLTLTKPGVTVMVMITTLAGYVLGLRTEVDAWLLFVSVTATGLASGGAAALNMVVERELDALMRRTRGRPLPDRRLEPEHGLAIGVGLSSVGLLALSFLVNPLSGLICAATIVSYVFVYTPLKTRTTLCTVIGAVPGALPPVVGWTAARGELGPGAWVLFAILFFWQIPHFLAIAWKYRADYARGGYAMLPVVDPGGASTSRQAVVYCGGLVMSSLLPLPLHMAGLFYFAGALICGLAFLHASVRFALLRSDASARRLFFASLIYLPVVLGLLLLDRTT